MKPRIIIFGLPPNSQAKLRIGVYKDIGDSTLGENVFNGENNDYNILDDYLENSIEIGSKVTIAIASSGIVPYYHDLIYNGSDISLVPVLQKETNTDKKHIIKDWDFNYWTKWNESKEHKLGLSQEKKYIVSRQISTIPIWESYYNDSDIDYLEKFHKLWVGFNAYASYSSSESGDKRKILSLVNSKLSGFFHSSLNKLSDQKMIDRLKRFQKETGLGMTTDILRYEISNTCYMFDFMEIAKNTNNVFDDITKELEGITFLNNADGIEVFNTVYKSYNIFMGSDEGRVLTHNLTDAYKKPYSPESIIRKGRLIYDNPYLNSDKGKLFGLESFFGKEYANDRYKGQTDRDLNMWEQKDPLFFRFLLILYKFRCAYFHGSVIPTKQNNLLAKYAYFSLYELFPAIL